MRLLITSLIGIAGFIYVANADPAPTGAPSAQAVVSSAVQAATQAAIQSAAPAIQAQTAPYLATLAALYGAFNLVLSGLQQLFGLGARSKNANVSKASTVALSVTQHIAGAPDVKTN